MYTLTIITETYSRTDSGKGWRTHPDTTETETHIWQAGYNAVGEYTGGDVNADGKTRHHNLTCTDTRQFFRRIGGRESAVRSHTPVGYIVTRLTSTNPGRTVRKVRKFRIADVGV